MRSGSNTGITAQAGIGCATNVLCSDLNALVAGITDGTIVSNGTAMKGSMAVAKNRSFTGGKQSNSGVTLNKEQYFQLFRKIRNAAPPKENGESGKRNMKHDHNNTNKEKTQ